MVGADAQPERIDEFPMFKGVSAPQTEVLYTSLGGKAENRFKGWEPLRPLQSFGAELTFARRLRAHDDTPLAIIKSAVGGTTVASDWNPDAPENGQKLYPRTLQLVRGALQELEQRGVRYQLEAVICHQGENDMLGRNLNTNYAAGLTKLIARLRTGLKAPELRWFIGEVSEKGIWGMDNRRNLAILREQQEQVVRADPRLRWVPTSHLAFEVIHESTQLPLTLLTSLVVLNSSLVAAMPRPNILLILADDLEGSGEAGIFRFVTNPAEKLAHHVGNDPTCRWSGFTRRSGFRSHRALPQLKQPESRRAPALRPRGSTTGLLLVAPRHKTCNPAPRFW